MRPQSRFPLLHTLSACVYATGLLLSILSYFSALSRLFVAPFLCRRGPSCKRVYVFICFTLHNCGTLRPAFFFTFRKMNLSTIGCEGSTLLLTDDSEAKGAGRLYDSWTRSFAECDQPGFDCEPDQSAHVVNIQTFHELGAVRIDSF